MKLDSDAYPALPGEILAIVNNNFLEAKGDRLWFGTHDGKVYRSEDRGKTWEINIIEAGRSIRSFAFKDEMNGIAVSNWNPLFNIFDNKAYTTSDGGATWTEIPAPMSPAVAGIYSVEGSADEPGACGT